MAKKLDGTISITTNQNSEDSIEHIASLPIEERIWAAKYILARSLVTMYQVRDGAREINAELQRIRENIPPATRGRMKKLRELMEQGKTYEQIAQETNCSRTTVIRDLKMLGIQRYKQRQK